MLESTTEFRNTFKELGSLKPPGVSGSRIKNLKDYFLSHVDDEDNLVNILIEEYNQIPVSNKLGPLYVIDAITRGLIDECGSNVEINADAPNGTAPAAIYKISEKIEDWLNDAIPMANDDVKDKICKLIDIWINCSTFRIELLNSIKEKYFKTFTPPGTPPRKKAQLSTSTSTSTTNDGGSTNSSINKDPTSVLQALANLAKTTSKSNNANNTSNTSPSSSTITTTKKNDTNATNSVNNSISSPPSSSSNISNDSNASNPNAIFQLLQNMNKMTNTPSNNQSNEDTFRDRNDRGRGSGHTSSSNSNSSYNDRKRERSPNRDSNNKPGHDGERNEPSNPHFRPKKSFIDNTIPQGCINVYSRTIFIGGVPHSMDDYQLIQTLKPYAEVQTCIINTARKHAFVKVYSRAEADQVIQAFSVSHPSGLRARWGVGFGPRDCCNYQTGISTIPIQRLTDADRKWILSAEWGGTTPDLPLQSGLFIEEPDIEVGHGVSSKSISRKMPTNSAFNGPKSDNRGHNNNGNNNNNHGGYNNQRFNPNHMPLNGSYGHNQFMQPPMPQQPMMSGYPQPTPPQHHQQFPPMGGAPPPHGMPPIPGMGSPQMNMPGMNMNNQPPMDQSQMMQAMMQAMSQMQNQQGGLPPAQAQALQGMNSAPNSGNGSNGTPDMNAMFQVMANMMQQQQQRPPSSQ